MPDPTPEELREEVLAGLTGILRRQTEQYDHEADTAAVEATQLALSSEQARERARLAAARADACRALLAEMEDE